MLNFKRRASAALLCGVFFLSAPSAKPANSAEPVVDLSDSGFLTGVMKRELHRCFEGMKNKEDAHIYFLSYRINETLSYDIAAQDGALNQECGAPQCTRAFHVEVRVGSPKFDNTHNSKECSCEDGEMTFFNMPLVPCENNELAIRNALWQLTENAYRKAQSDYSRELTAKSVEVQNQDTSNDFSLQSKHVFSEPALTLSVNKKEWEDKVRAWSLELNKFPRLHNSQVAFKAELKRVLYVNSEGTQIEQNDPFYAVDFNASTRLSDGMMVWLYDDVRAKNVNSFDSSKVAARIAVLGKKVEQLSAAKAAEPYSGPAILRGKAAAVFFHEVFGHRAEGHRQKDDTEGQTFTKKLGTRVMPSFISVLDDPTLDSYHGVPLVGKYKFDDEGVPAQKVTLVDHGILKAFLLGRSPIHGFSVSNGHGRCSYDFRPVARQANLLVVADAKREVPYSELRRQLIEQIRKQHKAYGLVFDEIAGGSTTTSSESTQAFSMQPLTVWRVYADGRADELVRGADIVGTPLISLENILGASSDVQTFNGSCGAESGWIPVSASAPSLLLRTIEIQKQAYSNVKPPLLPPPPPESPESATAMK